MTNINTKKNSFHTISNEEISIVGGGFSLGSASNSNVTCNHSGDGRQPAVHNGDGLENKYNGFEDVMISDCFNSISF